jgi:membrane protein YdbS with pleckstrin-like domain
VERRAPDTLAEAPRPPAAPLDPTIETDLWWGSYAGRTMLPSFVLCFALTLGLVFGAYLLWSDFGQGPAVARHEFYSVAVALWLFQLVRWLYRIIGCNYRLTTRRLFCGRGFLYPATAPVDLRDVQGVAVKQLAWERWLGIGRVYVQAKEAVMLEGVHQPERIAERIRQAAARRPAFES